MRSVSLDDVDRGILFALQEDAQHHHRGDRRGRRRVGQHRPQPDRAPRGVGNHRDLTEITNDLARLGFEIESSEIVTNHYVRPWAEFEYGEP